MEYSMKRAFKLLAIERPAAKSMPSFEFSTFEGERPEGMSTSEYEKIVKTVYCTPSIYIKQIININKLVCNVVKGALIHIPSQIISSALLLAVFAPDMVLHLRQEFIESSAKSLQFNAINIFFTLFFINLSVVSLLAQLRPARYGWHNYFAQKIEDSIQLYYSKQQTQSNYLEVMGDKYKNEFDK